MTKHQKAALDFLAAVAPDDGPVTGELALGLAFVFHALGLDSPGQWGNAYFRCPECERATDCDGCEDFDTMSRLVTICDCDEMLRIEHLQLSEGWVKQVVEHPREVAS